MAGSETVINIIYMNHALRLIYNQFNHIRGDEGWNIPLSNASINEADCHSSYNSHNSLYPSHLSVRPAKITCIKVSMMLVEPIIATSQNVQYCNVSRRSSSSSFQLLGLTASNSFASSLILSPKIGNSRSA